MLWFNNVKGRFLRVTNDMACSIGALSCNRLGSLWRPRDLSYCHCAFTQSERAP